MSKKEITKEELRRQRKYVSMQFGEADAMELEKFKPFLTHIEELTEDKDILIGIVLDMENYIYSLEKFVFKDDEE